MYAKNKFVCCLIAIVLAAFALPSVADNGKKIYSLQMSVPPAPGGQPQTTAPFTVKAKITNRGNSSIHSFNLFVTGSTIVDVKKPEDAKIAFTGSSISVTKADEVGSGESLTVTIKVNSCGDGQWSAAVWTGSSLNGQNFNLDVANSALTASISCGNLAVGAGFTVPDSTNPACVTGQRGYYDKDGSVPVNPLPFFVTNTVPANGQLHFRWPDNNTGDPLATFEYEVCGSGPLPPPGTTQVAWLNTDGSPASTPGTPAFITAQDCLDPDILPAPYGTLTAALGPTDGTILIDTTMPPRQSPPGAPPGSIDYPGSSPVNPGTPGTAFDVVIGTERITVQLVCLDIDRDPGDAGDCTDTPAEGKALKVVKRGVGGTVVPTDPHPAGALVMSTPLPLITADVLPNPNPANYVVGHQALMCIADQDPGFVDGDESEDEVATDHATTFIDIGDGWGNHP